MRLALVEFEWQSDYKSFSIGIAQAQDQVIPFAVLGITVITDHELRVAELMLFGMAMTCGFGGST